MPNSIVGIFPYKYEDMWVFDDPKVDLVREPFVSGMLQIIDILVKNIPSADEGFKLLFSDTPFPGYQASLVWLKQEYQGNWYYWEEKDKQGWLCPALLKYFAKAPTQIFCKAEK